MSLFVWLIFVLLLISVVSVVLRRQWLNSYVKKLPKIPFALLAPFLQIYSYKTQTELFQCIDRVINHYDGLASFWMGPKLVVICDDPVNMKTILMSKHCTNKPYIYRMITAAGNGIFTSTSRSRIKLIVFVRMSSAERSMLFLFSWLGHNWRADRKSINTVFTLSTLKAFQPIFNCHFVDFAKSLEHLVDQPESDCTKYIFLCNIGIICSEYGRSVRSTADAINIPIFQEPIFALRTWLALLKKLFTPLTGEIFRNLVLMQIWLKYVDLYHYRLWQIALERLNSFYLQPSFIYRFSSLYAEEKKICEFLFQYTPRIISGSQDTQINDSNAVAGDDYKDAKKMILIDKLLEMERQDLVDRQRVRDHIHTFIVAVSENEIIIYILRNQDSSFSF